MINTWCTRLNVRKNGGWVGLIVFFGSPLNAEKKKKLFQFKKPSHSLDRRPEKAVDPCVVNIGRVENDRCAARKGREMGQNEPQKHQNGRF
jgi:hypothetical protein